MRGTTLRSPLRDLGRVSFVALSIVLGLELLYLIVANLLLAGGLLERKINSEPSKLWVKLERPWTVVPGRVRLDGVTIRVQDSNAQFQLELGDVAVGVALWPLTERRLHATSVRVGETRFRFRGKIDDTPAARARARYFPAIPGFADPPLDRGWPYGKPSKVWTVQLEDIDAGVAELWVDQYRYAGPGRASGSFLLEPTRRVWIEDARVSLGRAPLTHGKDRTSFGDLELVLHGRMPEQSVAEKPPLDLLRGFYGSSTVSARVESLDFVRSYSTESELELDGGQGPFEARIRFAAGKLLPGSRASYGTTRLAVRSKAVELTGDARVKARVESEREQALASLSIEAERIQLRARGRDVRPARLDRPRLELASTTLELGERWHVARGSLRLPEISVPELVLIDRMAESHDSWRLFEGSASGELSADVVDGGRLRGELRARIDGLRARFGGVGLSTNARFSLGLRQKEVLRYRGSYHDLELVLSDLALSTRHGRTGRGSIWIHAPRVAYEDFVPKRVDARVEAGFADAEPILDMLGITRSTLPNILAGVLDLSQLRLTADVHHARSSTEVLVRQARTDAVIARGAWRKRQQRSDAAFLLTPRIARAARTGITIQNGRSSVAFLVGRDWLGEQARALGLSWPGPAATVQKTSGHTSRP